MNRVAARVNVESINDADRAEIGQLAAAQSVLMIEMRVAFTALQPLNVYNTRYLVRAEYQVWARLVDVSHAVSVWVNSVSWSKQFEMRAR